MSLFSFHIGPVLVLLIFCLFHLVYFQPCTILNLISANPRKVEVGVKCIFFTLLINVLFNVRDALKRTCVWFCCEQDWIVQGHSAHQQCVLHRVSVAFIFIEMRQESSFIIDDSQSETSSCSFHLWRQLERVQWGWTVPADLDESCIGVTSVWREGIHLRSERGGYWRNQTGNIGTFDWTEEVFFVAEWIKKQKLKRCGYYSNDMAL